MGLNGVRPRRPEQYATHVHVEGNLYVSMESGLEGRNNLGVWTITMPGWEVSMESGLEGRNNPTRSSPTPWKEPRLNGVRPRRPEQLLKGSVILFHTWASQWSPA